MVQAVSAYAMSVFRLLTTLCEDIQRAVAGFWWGVNKEHKSIHWAKWERLCQTKGKWGLRFRDFASLIKLWKRSRGRGKSNTPSLWWQKSYKQDTSKMLIFYKPKWDPIHLSFGEVFFGGDKSFTKEWDGESNMRNLLKCKESMDT